MFMFSMENYIRSFSIEASDHQDCLKFANNLRQQLPSELREYIDVFGEPEHNDRLLERCPWDHAVDLTPSFKPVKAKLYPIPKHWQAELDKFLEENLCNGQIRDSKSLMSSSFFFIKKTDGTLHPIQDYRQPSL